MDKGKKKPNIRLECGDCLELMKGTPMERRGLWIQTYTGEAFWPLDPRPEEVCLEDIAHSLSRQCRFAGHTREHYSVAQHSVLVARLVPREYALWGLLHDASEAYLVDLPRPIKNGGQMGELYKNAEQNLMKVICEKFNLSQLAPRWVMEADDVLLATEARDLMSVSKMAWDGLCAPLNTKIIPISAEEAKSQFLSLADELLKERSL